MVKAQLFCLCHHTQTYAIKFVLSHIVCFFCKSCFSFVYLPWSYDNSIVFSLSLSQRPELEKATTQLSSHFHFYNKNVQYLFLLYKKMYNILEFNFHPGTAKFDAQCIAHGRSPTTSSLSKNDRTWKKATTQLSSHFHFHNNRSWKKATIQFPSGTTKFDAHGRQPTSSSLPKNDRSWKKRQLNCLLTFTFTTTGVMGFWSSSLSWSFSHFRSLQLSRS